MEPYESVEAYRRRLLASLHAQPVHEGEVEFDSLQIFVNHECVGTVACDDSSHAMAAITQARPIQMVEIRTATGLLIGSLCAQDLRMRMARIPVGHHVLEISIHNRADGSSVQVAYQAAKPDSVHARPLAPRVRPTTEPSDIPLRRWLPHLIWPNILPVGRAAFVGAVLFLVADRAMDRIVPPPVAVPLPSIAAAPSPSAVSNELMTRQEEVWRKVLEGQDLATRTIKAQAQALAQAHQAIDGLTRAQHQLGIQVKQVSHQVALFRDEAREAGELHAKMESALLPPTVALSQTLPSEITHPLPAQPQTPVATQTALPATLAMAPIAGIAGGERDLTTIAPFTFLVSFQDNTSEKSIQDLFQEIRGRSGQINAGWYTVEVDLPQPQSPDLFVDSLKKMKIVKSVSTNVRTTASR